MSGTGLYHQLSQLTKVGRSSGLPVLLELNTEDGCYVIKKFLSERAFYKLKSQPPFTGLLHESEIRSRAPLPEGE